MSSKDRAAKRLADWRAFARSSPFEKIAAHPLPGILGLDVAQRYPLPSIDAGASVNRPILDAFEAFGFDPKNPTDWYRLIFIFADIHFRKRDLGRRKSWTDLKLCQLLADHAAVKLEKLDRPDTEICMALKKDKRFNGRYAKFDAGTIRRMLPVARKRFVELWPTLRGK